MQQPQLYPVNKVDLPPYPGPPVDKGEVLGITLAFVFFSLFACLFLIIIKMSVLAPYHQ